MPTSAAAARIRRATPSRFRGRPILAAASSHNGSTSGIRLSKVSCTVDPKVASSPQLVLRWCLPLGNSRVTAHNRVGKGAPFGRKHTRHALHQPLQLHDQTFHRQLVYGRAAQVGGKPQASYLREAPTVLRGGASSSRQHCAVLQRIVDGSPPECATRFSRNPSSLRTRP